MIENSTQTKKEELIRETMINFKEAWSRGDANAISQLFTVDCRRIGSLGEIQNGRVEVMESYKMLLERALPGTQLALKGEKVRFLTDDLAIWAAGFEIYSPAASNKIKGYNVAVMKKENGKWMILEMHPKIFPLQDQPTI